MQELSGEEEAREFQIGLTMSGAVSAGAYTAGVFDFLIQALDEWEKAREGKLAGVDPAKIPNHRVGLKVLSGASAGAITAAIGAVALADAGQHPVKFGPREKRAGIKCRLPKLYETWVVRPTLAADDARTTDFLTTTDLDGPPRPEDDFSRSSAIQPPDPEKPQPVTSLLNSRLLDEIAKAALDVKAAPPPRAYISKTLHIYLTLSNLRGVPYSISFADDITVSPGGRIFGMVSHGDRVHYAVTGLGSWPSSSAFADADVNATRIIAAAELAGDPSERLKWKDFAICSLASAAFPVGLAPRDIYTKPGEYKDRRFPIQELVASTNIGPDWRRAPKVEEESQFWFTTADGGVIDNDPFEYARFALRDNLEIANERTHGAADRAVIMVSPFPDPKTIKPEGQPQTDIISILASLLPALIDQSRFKPTELALAADPSVGSRYLIGPRRVTEDNKEQHYAIASGLLSGFGGFIARSFRDHDFQLGRRNCQQFLRQVFTVPPDHKIIKNAWPPEAQANPDFKAKPTPTLLESYCIIPLFGTAAAEVALPEWPRLSKEQFEYLRGRIKKRFVRVVKALLGQRAKGLGWFLLLPAVAYGRNKALEFIRLKMLSDLVRRDEIDGWALPPGDDIRKVVAELIDPSYHERNARDLADATALTSEQVEAALEFCTAAKGTPFEVWRSPWKDKDQNFLYTLASRKPSLDRRIGKSLGALFSKQMDNRPGG